MTNHKLNRMEMLRQKFEQSIGLPFQELLVAEQIEAVLEEEGIKYRQTIYAPVIVVWAFLSQVLSGDKSCQNVVSRIVSWCAGAGVKMPSVDTGGYSKARQKLPETVMKRLLDSSGNELETKVSETDLWCGRHVKILDGTTATMADTEANQAEYPQHGNQAAGCGFPLSKLVVMFSLLTGAVIAVMIKPWRCSETELARQMYNSLEAMDVALADRLYGTYVDLVLVQSKGADAVFRMHQRRNTDFRKGKILGASDHMVNWFKPKSCPQHMSKSEFVQLPETVTVREVCYQITTPGFRTREIVLVTTLLDAKTFTKAKLAELYKLRWQAEVDLKHIKTTLAMEHLRAKTPGMVRKEIYAHLLAYNLLRTLMWQAGTSEGIHPLRLSLQASRQHFHHSWADLLATKPKQRQRAYVILQVILIQKTLPIRPHRFEPRVVKRRPKPFPRMKQPRSSLKANLVT
jgi:hypothetical protein